MPEGIILTIITFGLVMVQINPYGAVVYAVIMGSWQPTDIDQLITLSMVSLAIMLLVTLIWKSRSGK